MNKKIGSLVVAGLTVMLLQACGGPKNLTPEEKEARQKATLNVYEDNRVWFKAGGNSPFYAWTKDPAKAFALMINGRIYNAKDISTISVSSENHSQTISVLLKSGETIKDSYKYGTWNVMWLICNAQKECPTEGSFYTSTPNSNIGKFLNSVHQNTLTPNRDWGYQRPELITDSRSIPTGGGLISFLTEAQGLQIQNKFGDEGKQWAKVQEEKAQQHEVKRLALEARAREIENEAVELRKRIRVGAKTNCGQVFELRLPMVGVQTIHGVQFIDLSRLYGPSAECRFRNGQYVGR